MDTMFDTLPPLAVTEPTSKKTQAHVERRTSVCRDCGAVKTYGLPCPVCYVPSPIPPMEVPE